MKTSKDIKNPEAREIIELLIQANDLIDDTPFHAEIDFNYRDEDKLLLTIFWIPDPVTGNQGSSDYPIPYESWSAYYDDAIFQLEHQFVHYLEDFQKTFISWNNEQSLYAIQNNRNTVAMDSPPKIIAGLHHEFNHELINFFSKPRLSRLAAIIDLAIKVYQNE